MVELTANNLAFELLDKANDIKYTKQIADIFDIAAVSNSYTNSFTIPKTPNNTQIMQQLGIVGDTSTFPYSKIPASLKDNGFPIIQAGWLKVKETNNEYKLSIIDGMIDFFKAIENKTLGADINLTQFDHEKNILSVVESFNNEFYTYIIADYNGKNYGTVGSDTGINIDYLVPCFNMGKLFELVMTTFGITYDNTNIEELDELYITYPKPPSENITSDVIADLVKSNYTIANPPVNGGQANASTQYFWDSATVTEGTLISNWKYIIPEDYSYRFDLAVEAYGLYKMKDILGRWVSPQYLPMTCVIRRNGQDIISFQSDPYNPVDGSTSLYCVEGDVIEMVMYAQLFILPRKLLEIHHNSTSFKVYKTNQGDIVLSDAFKDFQIKDFIKECFWYCSVTPILDVVNQSMSFVTVEQRLDFARAVDWSEMYVQRNSEKYDSGFAQKNLFTHKYNDPDDKSLNGALTVADANATAQKTIVSSITFAPEQIRTPFNSLDGESFNTFKFTIWSRDTKEDEDGNLSIEYKGLNQRFYFMKKKMSEVGEWLLLSDAVTGNDTVTQVPYADTTGTTYNQIVPSKYTRYLDVINNFRAHDIDLAMGLAQFLAIDMTRPVYFDKEAQYYMINKLDYQNGQISGGEFVRINKDFEVPLGTIDIQIFVYYVQQVRFRIPVLAGYNDIIIEDSVLLINGVDMEIDTFSADDLYITVVVNMLPGEVIPEPRISSFNIKTTNGTETRENVYEGPDVIITLSNQMSGTVRTVTANLQ